MSVRIYSFSLRRRWREWLSRFGSQMTVLLHRRRIVVRLLLLFGCFGAEFFLSFETGFFFEARAKFLVLDDFLPPVRFFDDRGERFDPVPGIEVMDTTYQFIVGGVDVSANNPLAAAFPGEVLELLLVFTNKADGSFHLRLDCLAQGKVFLAAPGSVLVIKAVDFEQTLISDISEHGQPLVVDSHGVKTIAVYHEVAAIGVFVNVFVDDLDLAEEERQTAFEKVIMVPPQVNDLGVALLDFFQDQANKSCVLVRPSAPTDKAPAVNDVAVEDKLLTVCVFEEIVYLVDLTIRCAQVHIREKDCLVG